MSLLVCLKLRIVPETGRDELLLATGAVAVFATVGFLTGALTISLVIFPRAAFATASRLALDAVGRARREAVAVKAGFGSRLLYAPPEGARGGRGGVASLTTTSFSSERTSFFELLLRVKPKLPRRVFNDGLLSVLAECFWSDLRLDDTYIDDFFSNFGDGDGLNALAKQ